MAYGSFPAPIVTILGQNLEQCSQVKMTTLSFLLLILSVQNKIKSTDKYFSKLLFWIINGIRRIFWMQNEIQSIKGITTTVICCLVEVCLPEYHLNLNHLNDIILYIRQTLINKYLTEKLYSISVYVSFFWVFCDWIK